MDKVWAEWHPNVHMRAEDRTVTMFLPEIPSRMTTHNFSIHLRSVYGRLRASEDPRHSIVESKSLSLHKNRANYVFKETPSGGEGGERQLPPSPARDTACHPTLQCESLLHNTKGKCDSCVKTLDDSLFGASLVKCNFRALSVISNKILPLGLVR